MSWFSRLFRRPSAAQATPRAAESLQVRGRAGIDTANNPYVLPNDLSESQRLDLQHYILREALHGNILAPVTHPRRILDLGGGTGRWAYEVARQFPDAEVIATDIVQPQRPYREANEPPAANFRFQVADVLQPLPFPDATFDLVHMRFLVTAIPAAQWPGVVREIARVTAPGGWVELIEGEAIHDGGAAVERLNGWGVPLLERQGIDMRIGARLGALLADAGLTTIATRQDRLLIGPQGQRSGMMMAVNLMLGMRGGGEAIAKALHLDPALNAATLHEAEEYLNSPASRAYLPIYLVTAQKPA